MQANISAQHFITFCIAMCLAIAVLTKLIPDEESNLMDIPTNNTNPPIQTSNPSISEELVVDKHTSPDIFSDKSTSTISGNNKVINDIANRWITTETASARKYGKNIYYDTNCVEDLFYQQGLFAPYASTACHFLSSVVSPEIEATCGEFAFTFSSVPPEHTFKVYTNKKDDPVKTWYYKPDPRAVCQRPLPERDSTEDPG